MTRIPMDALKPSDIDQNKIDGLKGYTENQHIALATSYSQLDNILGALFAGERLNKREKEILTEFVTQKMQAKFPQK